MGHGPTKMPGRDLSVPLKTTINKHGEKKGKKTAKLALQHTCSAVSMWNLGLGSGFLAIHPSHSASFRLSASWCLLAHGHEVLTLTMTIRVKCKVQPRERMSPIPRTNFRAIGTPRWQYVSGFNSVSHQIQLSGYDFPLGTLWA